MESSLVSPMVASTVPSTTHRFPLMSSATSSMTTWSPADGFLGSSWNLMSMALPWTTSTSSELMTVPSVPVMVAGPVAEGFQYTRCSSSTESPPEVAEMS